jgi:tRNA G18 (ribose-2'-O)-methylase SpoU
MKAQPYLLIANIAKKSNIRCLIKNAVAFGVKIIFVAGQRKFNFDANDESSDIPKILRPMMKEGHFQIVQFEKLTECIQHIHSLGIKVIGVEIDETAVDVEDTDNCFSGDTAFMMGNEGTGMNEKQMTLCDGFVKISQYGGGTASLNVSIAAGIILQRFYAWSQSKDCILA